jgi:hypothetical protein
MFDGFKTRFRDKNVITHLSNYSKLNFNTVINDIGEVIHCYAKYKGLKFKMYPLSGLIEITGSMHKYFNDGIHNMDDFTYSNLKDAIQRFEQEFGINPMKTRLNNLEFGFNLMPQFPPSTFINVLLSYKWNSFNRMQVIGKGDGKECKLQQYSVKIYNKALQYAVPINILRIEKKVLRMCALKLGVINLSDLLNSHIWEHCNKMLMEMFNNTLISESFSINILNRNEQRIYNTVVDQSKWITLSLDKKKRYKKAFNKIILEHGSEQYRIKINELLEQKFVELLDI